MNAEQRRPEERIRKTVEHIDAPNSGTREGNKHHYVPRSYLKRWAANGLVGVVDVVSGARYKYAVANIAMERGFYALSTNNRDSESLEKAFHSVESPASKVLSKIEHGAWPLSQGERVTLAAFVALQALRGPDLRKLMEAYQTKVLQRETEIVREYGAAEWFAKHGLHVTKEQARAAWDAAITTEKSLVDIDAEYHAEQIALHGETVLPYLLSRHLTLVRFDEPTLITSDAPVSLQDKEDGSKNRWGLLNAPSVSLPLNRTKALVLGAYFPLESKDEAEALLGGKRDKEIRGSEAWSRRLNARTIHNAHGKLFHHPDDSALVPDEYRERK